MNEYAVEEGVTSIGSSAIALLVRGTIFKSRVVVSPAFFAETEMEVIANSNVGDCMKAFCFVICISPLAVNFVSW